jgi:hypothetical protein
MEEVKMLVERRGVATYGVLLVFMLALGALVSCADTTSQEQEANNTTTTGEAGDTTSASRVVVSVSGTYGLGYAGNYGTLDGQPQTVNATVEDEPTDYDVQYGDSNGAFADLQKTQESSEGELRVQILVDGALVAESATYSEPGWGGATVRWSSQGVYPKEEAPPGEENEEESHSNSG